MKLVNEDGARVHFIAWSEKDPELLLTVAKKLGLKQNMTVDSAIGQVETRKGVIVYRPKDCQCGVFLRTVVDLGNFWKVVEGAVPITLMFKTPDVFDSSDYMSENYSDLSTHDEKYWSIREQAEAAVKKFVRHGELVTIIIDPRTKTAEVK